MLKKIYLVVDCIDDAQRDQLQAVANEVSNMRMLSAAQLLRAYPYFRERQGSITRLFRLISSGGVRSVLSAEGISLITRLAKS
jgi:hypothetical protein